LNNYLSSYGENVALDVSVSISGALDCNFQKDFIRSQRLWQPMIVAHMKDMYFGPKWGQRISHKLGREKYQGLMRAKNIVVSLIPLFLDFFFGCSAYSGKEQYVSSDHDLRVCFGINRKLMRTLVSCTMDTTIILTFIPT
jgi:hypothetical protein